MIYIGTNGGRIFIYNQDERSASEINVPFRKNPDGDKFAEVNRIVVVHNRLAFATYKNYVLRIIPPNAEPLAALPKTRYFGLTVAREREDTALYAASDNEVYVSRDPGDALGNTWRRASRGLPKRAHCADLSYTAVDHSLYLSTYGRSFWRAKR